MDLDHTLCGVTESGLQATFDMPVREKGQVCGAATAGYSVFDCLVYSNVFNGLIGFCIQAIWLARSFKRLGACVRAIWLAHVFERKNYEYAVM